MPACAGRRLDARGSLIGLRSRGRQVSDEAGDRSPRTATARPAPSEAGVDPMAVIWCAGAPPSGRARVADGLIAMGEPLELRGGTPSRTLLFDAEGRLLVSIEDAVQVLRRRARSSACPVPSSRPGHPPRCRGSTSRRRGRARRGAGGAQFADSLVHWAGRPSTRTARASARRSWRASDQGGGGSAVGSRGSRTAPPTTAESSEAEPPGSSSVRSGPVTGQGQVPGDAVPGAARLGEEIPDDPLVLVLRRPPPDQSSRPCR